MADVRAQLRAFALSLPGASEDFPWGERVAKVNGKVFVFLGPDHRTGPPLMTVKLVESHGHALVIEGAEPARYGLGRSGWVNVPLHAAGITLDLLRDWIEESYRIVAPKRLIAELERRLLVRFTRARRSPALSVADEPKDDTGARAGEVMNFSAPRALAA